jgi:hypothetical protein
MMKTRHLVCVTVLCALPVVALAQTGGSMSIPAYPGIGPANPVPGGLTLVPGTVVTPGVGGSAVTGTVPLAGTVGSAGVGNFNPGLGALNPGASGNTGALYPPAIYPQGVLPGTLQSTLPQTGPMATGGIAPNGFVSGPPTIANCPAGITSRNGTC